MNKITTVKSYRELEEGVANNDRSFLLLYKGGSAQSDCALQRIQIVANGDAYAIYTADVNDVRDIHPRLEVKSAPSLVVFEKGKVVNIIKGCQTESAYGSILAGKEIGAVAHEDGKPVKRITVYTTPTCSWCNTLKKYFDQHQVHYREINVAADTAAAEAMVKKSGQQGVPQTEINGQMIVGFDKARINQLLEIQ